ncbi:hypothetical protein [Acidocella sp.]|uniref:hypothetical protein n=1 Tax=Acidocella sp. TaxID=50710 RepID=UPI003CFC800A
MSASLADDLNGSLRVWLESSGYARRLLLGEGGDPWAGGPAKYLSFFTQARGLLRADVAVVDLGEMFTSWLARAPGLATEMGAKKRAAYPMRRMLEEEGPRRLIDEVAEAVGAHLQGQVPLVLSMPAPGAWMAWAQAAAGREPELDDDLVEDAAMYAADFLRCVATRPVGGLLLVEGEIPGPAERYTPVLNAARHYRWAVVGRDVTPGSEGLFNAAIGTAPAARGCDVSAPLFAGEPLPELVTGLFRFAEIPVGHVPEAVLDALARLRS